VWSLADAREALERMVGATTDWTRLDEYLISYLVEPSMRATVMASSLAATLELVREGQLELHQQGAFAPIYLRKRAEEAASPDEPAGPGDSGTA
jgi:segregation and condensation protein A